ncbi:hypothetical protein OPQ81_005486 [Rhizoctonia solani]|nr:hypothetical protein OPQ81_005486 [Rhizoctonia solani]
MRTRQTALQAQSETLQNYVRCGCARTTLQAGRHVRAAASGPPRLPNPGSGDVLGYGLQPCDAIYLISCSSEDGISTIRTIVAPSSLAHAFYLAIFNNNELHKLAEHASSDIDIRLLLEPLACRSAAADDDWGA